MGMLRVENRCHILLTLHHIHVWDAIERCVRKGKVNPVKQCISPGVAEYVPEQQNGNRMCQAYINAINFRRCLFTRCACAQYGRKVRETAY